MTQLDQPTVTYPTPKFREPGEQVVMMVVDRHTSNVTDFTTRQPRLKPNGEPMQQDVLTGILMDGTTATVQAGDGPAAKPGDLMRLYIKGQHRFAYYEAKREHGALSVGDVIRQRFVGEQPSSNGQPMKVTDFTFRRHKAGEEEMVARAEREYQALHAATPLDGGAAPAPQPATSVDDF